MARCMCARSAVCCATRAGGTLLPSVTQSGNSQRHAARMHGAQAYADLPNAVIVPRMLVHSSAPIYGCLVCTFSFPSALVLCRLSSWTSSSHSCYYSTNTNKQASTHLHIWIVRDPSLVMQTGTPLRVTWSCLPVMCTGPCFASPALSQPACYP